jgi:hypothetical protein
MDFVMYCHDNKIYIIEQTKNAEKIIENATEQGKDNEMGFITQKTRKILSKYSFINRGDTLSRNVRLMADILGL